jgi:vancomycin resistance protein YoaR
VQRVQKVAVVAAGTLAAIPLLATVGWAIDARLHDGEVSRNVTLAGRRVGGLGSQELAAAVDDLTRRWGSTPVEVHASPTALRATAAELGVAVDPAATTAAALRTGRSGSLPARVWSWAVSALRPRRAPLRVRIDTAALRRALATRDAGPTQAPVEPTITWRKGRFEVVPGRPGRGIDAEALADAIVDAAAGGGPIRVEARRTTVRPRFDDDRAAALAEEATRLTRSGIPVRAGDTTATVPAASLRSWITARAGADDLELALDPDETLAGLARLLAGAGTKPQDASFRVTADGLVPTPARPGTACCAPAAVDRLLAAVLHRPDQPVELPLRTVAPKRTEAEAARLGIKEPVASFTTRHKCCEPRVRNIHRIADLVRGAIIEPGDTFSVNGYVGKRTTDKGFVVAGVIENGEFKEDVGGGVSQFATTLFNAAFFAGLEFREYQSHSLYISRYPYGREATMGWPHPDLKIYNPTPYGVLIWPTYTDTSITVTLYSTKYWASVTQGTQTKGTRGSCTVVTTQRLRTLPDGTVKTDTVRATYRAAEGVDCNEPAPPGASATSTTSTTSTTPTTTPPTTGPP